MSRMPRLMRLNSEGVMGTAKGNDCEYGAINSVGQYSKNVVTF
jgi:hypothetical protein